MKTLLTGQFYSETYEYADEEINTDLSEVVQVSEYHDQNKESTIEVIDEIDVEDLSQAETDNMEVEYHPMSYDVLAYMEDYWGHNFQQKVNINEKDMIKISEIYRDKGGPNDKK